MYSLADPSTSSRQGCTSVIKSRRTTQCAATTEKNTRRTALSMGVGLLLTASISQPSYALFGIGESKEDKSQVYETDTTNAIGEARKVLDVPRDDPQRDSKIDVYKKAAQRWVAKYRQDKSFQGRMSYQDMYSVFNAISGHFNSFGYQAPIPKKRLEVIVRDLNEAEAFLKKGR